jgi:menaquinone-dependent protoporphyrinogen oxidase
MSSVLILYASYDGQTARIAERIRDVAVKAGHRVALRRFDGPDACGDIARHDAVVVGAAIRFGHHDRALEKALRPHSGALSARPNAFFSVCLSAGGPGAKPDSARKYVEDFCKRTAWEPRETASFAGALLYSRYSPFIRFMMRLIVGSAGGETDTSRDYEYTDWVAVERFAKGFVERLSVAKAA